MRAHKTQKRRACNRHKSRTHRLFAVQPLAIKAPCRNFILTKGADVTMDITVIRASNRKNSSTYNAAQYFISKLGSKGEVYEFTLPDNMPHICRGCYACLHGHEDKCGGYEYLKPINEAIAKSQLIIFCCPVWCFHAPGQIKSFLDHYGWRWLVHRPNFDMINKQAVIITTAGGGGMKSAANDIKDSMNYWGVAKTHIVTHSVQGYFWNDMPDNFKKSFEKKLDKLAAKVEKHAKNLKPSLKVRCLSKMFEYLHVHDKMWEIDNQYWKENRVGIGRTE